MLETNVLSLKGLFLENQEKFSEKTEEIQKLQSFDQFLHKMNENSAGFAGLQLECWDKTKAVSEDLKKEYETTVEERKAINNRIQTIQQSIVDLKSSFLKFKKDTNCKQEGLVNEIEKVVQEKNQEIQQLKNEIEYQENVTEFFKKISCAEILEISSTLKIRIKILKDEHVFSLIDQGDSVLYSPISFTQSPDAIPNYLKEEIAFSKLQYPMLFFNILQYLLNNN
jgi:hypothetical protein